MEEMNAVKAIDMAEGYLLKSLFEHECNGAPDVIIKEVEVPQYIPEKKTKNIGFGVVLGFIFALVLISTILRVLRK